MTHSSIQNRLCRTAGTSSGVLELALWSQLCASCIEVIHGEATPWDPQLCLLTIGQNATSEGSAWGDGQVAQNLKT